MVCEETLVKAAIRTTLALASVCLLFAGCGLCHRCQDPCPAAPYSCYGFYSTCWRPWPEECPTCPSYAIVPPPRETVLSDHPLNTETLPPGEMAVPEPDPKNPLPPVIDA